MTEDSTETLAPSESSSSHHEIALSDERRRFLAAKLDVLLVDLVKIRELEPTDCEPATPWPWDEDVHDR